MTSAVEKVTFLREGRSRVAGTDDNIAFRLSYVGSLGKARILVSTSHIKFFESNTLDSLIGSGGIIDITSAAYDTIKELVDYINKFPAKWRAWPEAGLPTDDTSTALLNRATSASDKGDVNSNVDSGLKMFFDSSVILKLQVGIQWRDNKNKAEDKNAGAVAFFMRGRTELRKSTTTIQALLEVIECDDVLGTTRVLQASRVKSNNSAIAVLGDLDVAESPIFGDRNKRLVCRVSGLDAVSTGEAAHKLSVIGEVEPSPTGEGFIRVDSSV